MSTNRKPGGRLNSLRDGIFAKELVIASTGESQEEFERLRRQLWDCFKPQDIAQEILVAELLVTYWRLQRPRRCEAAEIRKQIETARYRRELEQLAKVKTLKHSFFFARCRLDLEPNLPAADRFALDRSLAETRRGLESTPLGVEFLIEQLEGLKRSLKTSGYLAPHMETLLQQVCGLEEADDLSSFLALNQLAKKERQKVQPRGNEQVRQNEGNSADKNANPKLTADDLCFLRALRQLEQEIGVKVQPRENEQVEREEVNTADKNSNPIVEAEKFALHFEQAFKDCLEACQPQVRQMLFGEWKERCEQNTADTGADPNVGGERFEALRALYQEISQLLEEIQLREEDRAERDEQNPAEEDADLSLADPHAFFLSVAITRHIGSLKLTKMRLEFLEAFEEKTYPASLVLLPPERQDRIHRAEAALERYLLKILDRLHALQGLGTN